MGNEAGITWGSREIQVKSGEGCAEAGSVPEDEAKKGPPEKVVGGDPHSPGP